MNVQAKQGFRLCAALLLAVFSAQSHALQFRFDLNRAKPLVDCDVHRYAGETDEANACYRELQKSTDFLIQAEAAAALGEIRKANRLFRRASEVSDDPAIKTGWGKVFLSTHQVADAIALFREALLFDPNYHPARLGLAQALTDTYQGEARKELAQILNDDPAHPGALIQMARLELENQNTTVARRILDAAAEAIDTYQVPPLEIFALQAAANLLDDKSIEPWVKKALEINPNYGSVYYIPARYYIITYRYREAIGLYQKAVSVNPKLAVAQRDLGTNLLRVNDIFGARYHLNQAFDLDPFDAQTINSLRLLDGLDDMRVTVFDVDDEAGNPLGRVLLRLDEDEADALEPYVLDLSERAMRTFTERYDFRLQKPMVVELFHDHDDFGVRTVSTPGIGLLGVTFGYLTAMDSPKARAPGEFHWGSTLWHEIAHVYTLSATNHLLPRWMSEGLSVYEEWTTGPLNDRMLSFPMLEAIRDKTLLPIETLDLGFVRPTYNGQVQVSYAQAGLLCHFIASHFGHDALTSLLKDFGRRTPLATALQNAVGMDAQGLDEAFLKHLDERYGELAQSLDEYSFVAREAQRALDNQDWEGAVVLGTDLIQRYPEYITPGSGYDIVSAAHTASGNLDAALANRWDWFKRGGHEPDVLQQLIRDLRDNNRFDDAVQVMKALNWVMPYSPQEHAWLGEYFLENGDSAGALREFTALLAVTPGNPAEAYYGRAQAAMLDSDQRLARNEVLYALEVSPFYRPAQKLLLELANGTQYD